VLASATLCAQSAALPPGNVRPAAAEPGHAPSMSVTEMSTAARTFDVRFGTGDEILSGLTELALRHGITSAHLTGIGGLARATLGWGDPAGGIKTIAVTQKCELVSLVGNISIRDGRPYVHAHATVSFADGSTKAGHLIEAHVTPLAEITLIATRTGE
jgi:hypothetical protein